MRPRSRAALQRGGYATDPDYVAKLTAVAAKLKGGTIFAVKQRDRRLRG